MQNSRSFKIAGIGLILLIPLVCLSTCIYAVLTPIPPPQEASLPSWSPDSQHLVYECYLDGPTTGGVSALQQAGEYEGYGQAYYTEDAADICVIDIDERNHTRLTKEAGGDWHPKWSPDGSQIAYVRQDGIYLITPDGSNKLQLFSQRINDKINLVWSPDGRQLLFSTRWDTPYQKLYLLDVNTSQLTNLTLNTDGDNTNPRWILGGTKIIFLHTVLSGQGLKTEIRMTSSDGAEETVIYNPDIYLPDDFFAVSDEDEIVFGNGQYLFNLDLNEMKPVETPIQHFAGNIFSWSSKGDYLAYQDNPTYSHNPLKILSVETKESFMFWALEATIESISWSPDDRKIAATVSKLHFETDCDERSPNRSIHLSTGYQPEHHICIFDIEKGSIYSLLAK